MDTSSIPRGIVFIKRHSDSLVTRLHVDRQDVISQCIWKRDLSLRYCTCMRHEIALVITAYWGRLCAFWPVHTEARDQVHVQRLVYTCTNCMKPQLDMHGVPTLTISSIAGWPICAVAVGSPLSIFTPLRQKSSPTNACATRSLFFLFSFSRVYIRSIGNWFTGLTGNN